MRMFEIIGGHRILVSKLNVGGRRGALEARQTNLQATSGGATIDPFENDISGGCVADRRMGKIWSWHETGILDVMEELVVEVTADP